MANRNIRDSCIYSTTNTLSKAKLEVLHILKIREGAGFVLFIRGI